MQRLKDRFVGTVRGGKKGRAGNNKRDAMNPCRRLLALRSIARGGVGHAGSRADQIGNFFLIKFIKFLWRLRRETKGEKIWTLVNLQVPLDQFFGLVHHQNPGEEESGVLCHSWKPLSRLFFLASGLEVQGVLCLLRNCARN